MVGLWILRSFQYPYINNPSNRKEVKIYVASFSSCALNLESEKTKVADNQI